MTFKQKVRSEIDYPMLKSIVPAGTVLRDVMCEVYDNGITFGRQLASYPLLVSIPAWQQLGTCIDVTVTGHGQRSITAVPYPLDINSADPKLVGQLFGTGEKHAYGIVRGRPYIDYNDLIQRVGNVKRILPYIKIG